MESNQARPFSKDYVIRTTVKHMRKSIEISIRKTYERIAEFDGNHLKSRELLETLSLLHAMRKEIDEFSIQDKDTIEAQA